MIRTFTRSLAALAVLVVALTMLLAATSPPASAEPDAPTSTTAETSTTAPSPDTTPAETTPTETTQTAPPQTTTTPSTTPPSTVTTTPPSSTTPPKHDWGKVSVQAIDLTTHETVKGVRVEFAVGDTVTEMEAGTTVNLPAGTVIAHVVSIPDAYSRAWIDPPSATLAPGGDASFIVSLVRKGQVGGVHITKRDRITGAPLSGARYRLTASHSDQSVILETGSSGGGWIQLAPGGYDLQEISAPAGYQLDSTLRFVEVTPSQTRYLTLYDSPITPPVVARDPAHRQPLTSIPTGRTS